MDDDGGLVAQTNGSVHLYFALSFLSVVQLRTVASARVAGHLPDAVVAGVAYWDHAYLLIAAVYEVRRCEAGHA